MTHGLTAASARIITTSDQVIYDEIDAIHRAINTAALAGELDVTVDDGTLMTESTPSITIEGTGFAPFTPGDTVIIASETIVLGGDATDGTGVKQVVADINNVLVSGLRARQVETDIVLTYETTQSNWAVTIAEGSGSALTDIGLTAGTYTPTDPESVAYYNVWNGQTEDRKKAYEFAQVVNHFQGLGYNIVAKKNTVTQNTFIWELYW